MNMPPLGVYIHLPWCESKCPYCDFNSHPAPAALADAQADYLNALLSDLAAQADWVSGREVRSVFIGGGTPSLFAPSAIDSILSLAADRLTLAADVEVTMEANPGSLERGHFAGYRAAGVNRLSIGGQSFDAAALRRLGRLHGPDDTRRAIRRAQNAGFERLNVDLMYALPGQTLAGALADVEAALASGVSHVSHYQLTLEPNTRFYAAPPRLPDEDSVAAMQDATGALFERHGLKRYEVSALAVPDQQCRHNLNYWEFGDYLAIGAGAHGKLTGVDGEICRYQRPAHPRSYVDALKAAPPEPPVIPLSEAARIFEFMLNALRLTSGFSATLFERRTGLAFSRVANTLRSLLERSLLETDAAEQHWRPSVLGARFLDDLIGEFLPEPGAP